MTISTQTTLQQIQRIPLNLACVCVCVCVCVRVRVCVRVYACIVTRFAHRHFLSFFLTPREALAKETMSAGSLFESSRTAVPVNNAGGATHYTEIDTKADRDTRAILEKNIRLNE